MYDRDAKAENKEQLERLLVAIERLAETHAKDRKGEDNSNKELLDWLKKNGDSRSVRDVPTSDDRADALRTTQRRTNAIGGDGEQSLDATTVNRVNSIFKALQGDLGGFQRTISSIANWGERATKIVNNLQSITPDTTEGEINLKQAKKELLGKLSSEKGGSDGLKEYFKQLSPDPERIEFHRQWMTYDEAVKQATKEKEDALLKRVRSLPRKQAEDNGLLVPPPPGSNTSPIDGTGLAKIVTTAVIGARLATVGTIEGNRQYQMLDAGLATNYAMFNQKQLLTDMKYARNISPSLRQLLDSEGGLQSTLEPIKSLGATFSNNALSGITQAFDIMLTPVSALSKEINGASNKTKGMWEEVVDKASLFATVGSTVGGIAGLLTGGVGGAIRGAALGGAIGAGFGGVSGAGLELVTERRRKELDKIIGDPNDKSKRGMIGTFANDLVSLPLCPPRRFVP
jgi:hypothetical protein